MTGKKSNPYERARSRHVRQPIREAAARAVALGHPAHRVARRLAADEAGTERELEALEAR